MDILKSRRRFLMQMAAAGTLIPLSSSGLAHCLLQGQQEVPCLKVVFFIIPDGLAVDSFKMTPPAAGVASHDGKGLWFPKTEGEDTADFELNEVSKELADYRGQSLYLRGLILGPGNVGHKSWDNILRDSVSSMRSIDMVLGDAMPGNQPIHRSLFAGPHAGIDGTPWYVSWDGANIRSPQQSPLRLYESVFGAAPGQRRQQQVRNTHVFEPIREDIAALRARIAGAQRGKLDAHLDALEQVAKDLEGVEPAECQTFALEDHPISSARYRNEVQANHHKVVAAALACGVTRVATIQVGRSAESLNILDVSASYNPHHCAHGVGGEETWKASRQWYVRQAKLFLDELKRHTDPDVNSDNLLQHTLVVLTSEMADGSPEHTVDMPLVLMGGASGLLRSGTGNGRYFDIKAQGDRAHWTASPDKLVDMQRIWATLARAAGTTVPYGGNIEPVTGIFSNVT
ncbi:DUF1552 domain-containing protein [Pseudomonas xanthosomatis]|uniref:DUF1552 domain-containing protein n=1 Tax=Pseudomonas xanthosomatis TaxID=2842356 RepID=UPI003511F820